MTEHADERGSPRSRGGRTGDFGRLRRSARLRRTGVTGRVGRWVLLVTALAQAVSPVAAGFDQGSSTDPVVVPPGPIFAVWGVVLLGCLAVAARGLPRARAASADFARLHLPLSLTQVGFVVWLVLAATAPAATVPVFAVMLVVVALALRAAPDRRTSTHLDAHPAVDGRPPTDGAALEATTRWDRRLIEATLGVYAGWSAAAVWLNTAAVLPDPSRAVLGLLLVGAVATEVVLLVTVARTGTARLALGAAGAWALLGVTVSTAGAGVTVLLLLAAAGCVAVVITAMVGASRVHHRARALA